MPVEDLADLITHGREERNIEYKRSMNWADNETKAMVAKSCLGMANIRDGGFIIFGVEQQGEDFIPRGMSEDDYNSFAQDHVSTFVNEYADPFVEVTVSRVPHDNMKFIVIQVEEFSEIPVICKKDGRRGLEKGATYTRPRRRFETAKVPSQSEMREIWDMSIDKGLQSFQSRAARAGLKVGEFEEEDQRKFDEELGDL